MRATAPDSFLGLSRLTLAVVLLYVRLVAAGCRAIKNGQRHLVDRAGRRDLSIFQIGLRLVKRRLTNGWPVFAKFIPTFSRKLSGG